jgi:CheY-like chemotaxis protein
MIKRGVDRGTGITRRLLAFAQRPTLQARWIDADEFVAGMAAVLRQSLPDSVAIETVPGAGSVRIWVDANQLETAILNLAANARAAMPQGGKLVVETTKMLLDETSSTVNENVVPGRYVVISVRDTGVGMSKEMIAKTFEPFFTKELGYGTGGGLSQVYEFVRESKGHVDILSEPGKGTVVRLWFVDASATDTRPIAPTAPEQVSTTNEAVTEDQRSVRASSASEADEGRLTKALSDLRVLVIEDESLVAMLVEDMLDQLGCVVVGPVSDLQPALDVVARSEIDFALLDVNLRGRPSYAAAEALEARAVPFIFISGYGQVDERWRSRPIIQKPFDLDRLRREMGRALAGA